MTTAMAIDSPTRELAAKLVSFFETGTAPEGLFAPDVFCDLSLPHWRLQSEGPDDLVALRLGAGGRRGG